MTADTPGAAYSPYQAVLGDAFAALHPGVRRAHLAPLTARGTLDVRHGSHWIVPLLVALMRLPAAGQARPVRLTLAAVGDCLEWTRQIGSSVLRTRQRAVGSHIVEQLGIGRVVFDLDAGDGALVYRQASMRIGPIVIPSFVAPRVRADVSSAPGGWRVEVTVTWRSHLVCHYAGRMELT
jgi:hypothetical protein